MKVEFKYPRCIDGKDYPKGMHELHDELVDHWFFKGLVKAKDVTVLVEPAFAEDLGEDEVKKAAPSKGKPKHKPKKKPPVKKADPKEPEEAPPQGE